MLGSRCCRHRREGWLVGEREYGCWRRGPDVWSQVNDFTIASLQWAATYISMHARSLLWRYSILMVEGVKNQNLGRQAEPSPSNILSLQGAFHVINQLGCRDTMTLLPNMTNTTDGLDINERKAPKCNNATFRRRRNVTTRKKHRTTDRLATTNPLCFPRLQP